MNNRIKRLYSQLKSIDVDAFLVTDLVNVKYLTGFDGTYASLLVCNGKSFLFTDSRYYERAVYEASGVKVVLIDNNWPSVLLNYKFKKLGFEEDSVSYGLYQDWKKKLKGVRLVPVKLLVEKIRQIKELGEIKAIRDAVALTDKLMSDLIFKVGITEEDLAEDIENRMRLKYKVKPSFSIIAAFGKNASIPHAKPGSKRLLNNQKILLDMGVELNGYSSDLTRTFWIGKITHQFRRIYNIVLTAQRLAIDGIRPGRSISEVDLLARNYIKDQGYGAYFGHSLGHGIGLAVHELPRISYKSKEKLEEGMVFSVEPGIYLPGWGGVRIEDLVLVTKNGCEALSKSPKELKDIVV